MVLHAPVALLSGEISRYENIVCWSGFANLFISQSDPENTK